MKFSYSILSLSKDKGGGISFFEFLCNLRGLGELNNVDFLFFLRKTLGELYIWSEFFITFLTSLSSSFTFKSFFLGTNSF